MSRVTQTRLSYKHLTLAQCLNVNMDRMTQHDLLLSLVIRWFIRSHSLFKNVRVIDKKTKEKSAGNMSDNFSTWRSYMTVKAYYNTKKEGARIAEQDFDLVY